MKASSLPVAICLLVLVGCDSAKREHADRVGATITSGASQEFLLDSPPQSPLNLTDAAANLSGNETVALIGKIDAGDFPAFQDGQATFMLSELPADGHGANDPEHADNCPFCKRRAEKAPKAIVNIVDEHGKTLPADARDLIGVQEGDRVIVVGTASYDESVDAITLQCTGVYTGPL